MHFKRRYKIYLCSVVLGQLESFRNCKGFSIIFRSFRCSLKCYESKNFSVLLRTDILQKAVVGFPFFSSSLFLFLLSFPLVSVILELIGPKKPTFWPFFTRMTTNFTRLVFKKTARCFQRILSVFQSAPFWSGKRPFRPFGINAAHFAESSSRIFENVVAKWTFSVQQFFRPKTTSKVAIIKTMKATIAFSPSPSFCLHALSFSPFLFFVRLVSKNRLDTQT